MNTHEYEAKEILKRYHVPIPEFGVASKNHEVDPIVKRLKLKEAVIKIQVHAGGRGKAGGVKFAKTPEEIFKVAEQLLGMKMVNNQTGPEGVVAHKILISKPLDIKKEYYLGAVIDRERGADLDRLSRRGDGDRGGRRTSTLIKSSNFRLSWTDRCGDSVWCACVNSWDGRGRWPRWERRSPKGLPRRSSTRMPLSGDQPFDRVAGWKVVGARRQTLCR